MRAVSRRATDYTFLSPAKHPYFTAGSKVTCTDLAFEVADEAVQLFGGLGYMAESEVERQYRDMRILGIGGGTTEILTALAAKTLGYQS